MPAKLLSRHRVEKPWGRRNLWGPFNDQQTEQAPIGEIWYQDPGDTRPDLLVKYLFTSDKLSVQVHPDDIQARARGLPRGKDECWLVLDAAPESTIALGPIRPIAASRLAAAARDGTIEKLLNWRPVKAGDFLYAPSGTIHAIGAGITLIEVQQNSDTTYRLYDYGRPRELHLEDGIAVADLRPYALANCVTQISPGHEILVEGPKFVLERRSGRNQTIDLPEDKHAWLIALDGEGKADGIDFSAGDCLMLNGTVACGADANTAFLLAYSGTRRIVRT